MFRCKEKVFIKFTILAIFLLTSLSGLFSQGKKVKVAVEETDIYFEPSVNSLVLGTVKKGDTLTLLSQTMLKMEWYYVLFTSEKGIKKSGYIRASFIEFIELVPKVVKKEEKIEPEEKEEQVLEEIGQKIRVIIKKANIRLKPDQKSQIIDQVPAGVVLQSKGKTEDWYQVDLPPDKDGIVISGYIHKSSVQEMKEEMKEVQPPLEPEPYVPVELEPQRESEEIPWPEKKG